MKTEAHLVTGTNELPRRNGADPEYDFVVDPITNYFTF